MPTYQGQSNNFTGQGSPNPLKLVLPRKNEMDPATQAAMLKLEQYINSLTAPALPFPIELPFSYAVSGVLVVPSGATGFLPPFYWPVPSGQTVNLVSVRYAVRSGTATLNIQKNGSNIATGIAVTSSPATTAVAATVANNDSFQPVLTAVSSADGLTVSFNFLVN